MINLQYRKPIVYLPLIKVFQSLFLRSAFAQNLKHSRRFFAELNLKRVQKSWYFQWCIVSISFMSRNKLSNSTNHVVRCQLLYYQENHNSFLQTPVTLCSTSSWSFFLYKFSHLKNVQISWLISKNLILRYWRLAPSLFIAFIKILG